MMVSVESGEESLRRACRFAVVTALPKEFAAMCAMLEGAHQVTVDQDPNDYSIGLIPACDGKGNHTVLVALQKKPANNSAAATASHISRSFPNIAAYILVGIAGGIPNVKSPDRHVRLGDVVVSNHYGVLQFDHLKLGAEKVEVRDAASAPSAHLLGYANRLAAEALLGIRPWEKQITGVDLDWASRPQDATDVLYQSDAPSRRAAHPNDPQRTLGQPRIHLGRIGSSNVLLKDPTLRDALRDSYGVLAIEMEASGLADGVWTSGRSYLVVRGICDYCDSHKNDLWQGYAAVAAAAYARSLMAAIPFERPSMRTDEVRWAVETLEHTQTALHDRANRLLEVVRRPWDPERMPPGALLRADCAAAVPFHGRDDECADLESWCASEPRLGIRLYSAAGGMGKTRLFVELCDRVKTRGWRAGFLLQEAANAPSDLWSALVRQTAPLLLVIDYAESRAAEIISLLSVARDSTAGPIRIILLARAAGDWWEALKREGDGVGDLLLGPATRWYELRPLAMDRLQRLASYQLAARAFAGALGKSAPSAEPDDLDAPHFERVLLLQMSAMAEIDGVAVKGDQGILNYVLQRERRFWSKQLSAIGLPPRFEEGVAQAMAVITLGGGANDAKHARMILREIPLLNDQTEIVCRAIVMLLHEAYPGVKFIEPMLPDLLGEHLVQVELGKDERLMDLVLGPMEQADSRLPS